MNKKTYLVIIAIFIIVFMSSARIVDKQYILLEINYEEDKFTLLNKSLETGNYPSYNHNLTYDYRISILSDEGKVLYSLAFDPSLLFSDAFYDNRTEGGTLKLNESVFFLAIPSFENAEKVEILKNGEKVFETGVYDVGAKSCKIK